MKQNSLILALLTFLMTNMAFAKSIIKKRNVSYYDFSKNDRLLTVSFKSTKNRKQFLREGMLPIGSAALTSSGAMSDSGIKGIIHAASGSMTMHSGIYNPSITGVVKAIKNSLRIAKRKGFDSVAIPFIGGGIFLNSIGISKNELAHTIISTALKNIGGLKLSFVAYTQNDFEVFEDEYEKALAQQSKLSKFADKILFRKTLAKRTNVLRGSITNFDLHKRELIINAANTELIFGGGLSGFIGKMSQESGRIDHECQLMIDAVKELKL
jgi:O-acetyl-ADP-ribose deacetylase (regulator of RNase III)